MTPKGKAKDLIMKFSNPFAKSCALILIYEMLDSSYKIWGNNQAQARDEFREYWLEVKQEIEKL